MKTNPVQSSPAPHHSETSARSQTPAPPSKSSAMPQDTVTLSSAAKAMAAGKPADTQGAKK